MLLLGLAVFDTPLEDWTRRLFFLIGMMLAGPSLLGKRRPREVEIALGPGYLDVQGAGLLNQRIRGRGVTGASTAYLTQGVGLVLSHRGRPVAFELHDESDADAARHALGIGHHGIGELQWRTLPHAEWQKWNMAAFVLLGALYGAMVALRVVDLPQLPPALMFFYAITFAICAIIVTPIASMREQLAGSTGIHLEPRGVILREPSWRIPYGVIVDVEVTKDGITILTHPEFHRERIEVCTRGALTEDERAHCVAQIIAAARRARGLCSEAPFISAQLDALVRAPVDSYEWLLRLDAAARQMAAGRGYRDSFSVNEAELWAALSNPEADVNVRAAAARVLVRGNEGSRKRIESIAASARDEHTERRIRIVLEPHVEEAGHALDEFAKVDGRRRRIFDPRSSF